MKNEKIIGILGGMGPYASVDLHKKIVEHTVAATDQEHLSIAHLSYPSRIVDRSTYLLDETQPNPVDEMTDIVFRLDDLGADVVAFACNTAHHAAFFEEIAGRLEDAGRQATLVSMIEETSAYVRAQHPNIRHVGVLCSLATAQFRLYTDALERRDLTPVMADDDVQREVVNAVIFDPEWGIKAQSHPIHPKARRLLLRSVDHLRTKGAELALLACTEFPLAITEDDVDGFPLLDPTAILARALIQRVAPEQLKPLAASP